LDVPEISPEKWFALVSLVLVLVLWIGAYRRERGWEAWFRGWEADRKARREAEERGEAAPPRDRTGPWG
jgi:hypothetical protein